MAISNGASGNTVGGVGVGNVIEYNGLGGVFITGAGTMANLLIGDLIALNGLDAASPGSGIWILDAPGNSILSCTIQAHPSFGIRFVRSGRLILDPPPFATANDGNSTVIAYCTFGNNGLGDISAA